MNAMTQTLAADLDRELKVIAFPAVDDVERLSDIHRRGIAKYEQRAADTRKSCKARVAGLKADLARITAEIVEVKANADADIARDKKLVSASRAALEILAAE